MESLPKSRRTNRKSEECSDTKPKPNIRDRLETLDDFKKRYSKERVRAPSNKTSGSMNRTTVSTGAPTNPTSRLQSTEIPKTTPPMVDLTGDSSSEDENIKKYSESLLDIMDHFDEGTGEEALDLQIKDTTTLSMKKAEEIQRISRNKLKATNSALDAIIEPRAVLSSISSHATATKNLMNHIDDEILRKLIGKAARAHADIVNYLRQEKIPRE